MFFKKSKAKKDNDTLLLEIQKGREAAAVRRLVDELLLENQKLREENEKLKSEKEDYRIKLRDEKDKHGYWFCVLVETVGWVKVDELSSSSLFLRQIRDRRRRSATALEKISP